MHPDGGCHERVEVDAAERGGQEADVAEGRVAAADRLGIEEDAPHVVLVGDRRERLPGVGDRHHELARGLHPDPVRPERVVDPLPGVGPEGEGLGRGAGLGADDEQRRERVEALPRGRHGGRIGRVEDADRQPVLEVAEGRRDDLGGQAAAAHAGHDGGREAGVAGRLAEGLERGDLEAEVDGEVQPAEAVGDLLLDRRVGRPESHVAVMETIAPPLVGRAGERGGDGRGEGRVVDPGVERARGERG